MRSQICLDMNQHVHILLASSTKGGCTSVSSIIPLRILERRSRRRYIPFHYANLDLHLPCRVAHFFLVLFLVFFFLKINLESIAKGDTRGLSKWLQERGPLKCFGRQQSPSRNRHVIRCSRPRTGAPRSRTCSQQIQCFFLHITLFIHAHRNLLACLTKVQVNNVKVRPTFMVFTFKVNNINLRPTD